MCIRDRIILEPGLSEALFKAIKDNTQEIEEMGQPAVLVVSPGVRPWLSKTLKHRTPDLTVLSYVEIPEDQAVKVIKTVAINLKDETNNAISDMDEAVMCIL